MAYESKNSLVLGRQLSVQSLSLSFKITGNATPASKIVERDNPALFALAVQGIDQITDFLPAGATAPTYASALDSTGVFNVLINVDEPIEKIVSALLIPRTGGAPVALALTSAPSDGIVLNADGHLVSLNVTSGVNLASASLDACIELKYIVREY